MDLGQAPELRLDLSVDPTTASPAIVEMEAAGADGVWVTETVRDPFLVLRGHIAATRRLRVATGVAIAFARSPMTCALSAHDLQRDSGGRFALGLGTQVQAHVERRFSMPWSEPAARIREYILALRAIWSSWNNGEPLRFEGRFYRHTLMTPFFDPGPNGFGPPPVVLGGVGERMTAAAGEAADGFLCAPLSSRKSFAQITAANLGNPPRPFVRTMSQFVITGADPAHTARVKAATRERIAFYASTPAYRSVLDLHGWADLGERLARLARAGEWGAMAAVVDEDMLDAFTVAAEPDRVAAAVHQRWGGQVERVALFAAADPGPEVWPAVFAEQRSAMRSTP